MAIENYYFDKLLIEDINSDVLKKKRKNVEFGLHSYLEQAYFEGNAHKNIQNGKRAIDYLDLSLRVELDLFECIEIILHGNNNKKEILGEIIGKLSKNEIYKRSEIGKCTDQEVTKMGSVEEKRDALLRLQKSRAKVMKRYSSNVDINYNNVKNIDEVRKMLDDKLRGESLSQEIINERNEARL